MATAPILIASDLHLCETIWSHNYDVYGDSYFALTEILRVAIENKVVGVFLAGDVFNSHIPSSNDVVQYRKFVDGLEENNIRLVFIEGQHDRSSRRSYHNFPNQSWCEVHKFAVHGHGQSIRLPDGEKVYFIDWHHADEVDFEFAKTPDDCSIIICHQAWRDFLPSSAKGDGCLEIAIPQHVTKVFTGDHHKHISLSLRDSNLKVYSPGATHLRKKDEPISYGVYIYRDGKVKSVPIRSRPIFRETLLNDDDSIALFDGLASVDTSLPDYVRAPLLILKYTDATKEFVEGLKQNEMYNVVAEYLPPEQEAQEIAIRTTNIKFETESIVFEAMEQKTAHNQILNNMAKSLWTSDNPKRTIDDYITLLEKDSCDSSNPTSSTSDATQTSPSSGTLV